MINEKNDRDIANELDPQFVNQRHPEKPNFGTPETDEFRPPNPSTDLKTLGWIVVSTLVAIWIGQSLLGLS